ncbi:hypothetical protein HZA76_04320 [Candidatus Roizmanbacteria bacterium]|nr:hypothetical protein [Candidatus Roizmanbacteria bacterium]
MVDKKSNDEKSIKEKQKALRFKRGGLAMMLFGGVELALTALNPLIGLGAIVLGAFFFSRGRKIESTKK